MKKYYLISEDLQFSKKIMPYQFFDTALSEGLQLSFFDEINSFENKEAALEALKGHKCSYRGSSSVWFVTFFYVEEREYSEENDYYEIKGCWFADLQIDTYFWGMDAQEIYDRSMIILDELFGSAGPDVDLIDESFFNNHREISDRFNEWDNESDCRKHIISNDEMREGFLPHERDEYETYMTSYLEKLFEKYGISLC